MGVESCEGECGDDGSEGKVMMGVGSEDLGESEDEGS